MPLKILIYCDDPGLGGAAHATHRLALGLAERGHTILYAQTAADTAWTAERKAKGITALDLPYDTIKFFLAIIDDRRVPTRLMIEHKPDLVIFSDALMESTLGAKEAAEFLRIPYLIVKHLVVAGAVCFHSEELSRRVGRSLAGAAGVITVSANNRAPLIAHFPELAARIQVIHNSVPDAFLTPSSPARRAEFRQRLGIPDTALAVLTAAAVNRRKGFLHQATLLKGLKAAGRLEDFVFVWAGEQDAEFFPDFWADLVAAGCADAIRACGFQSDVAGCLEASDVFLLPSEQEGMPLVVLEAMAKGVPVIASAVGGTGEAIGEAGALVPDPAQAPEAAVAAIAQRLLAWRDAPEERRRVGALGRERAAQAFGFKGMMDHYERAIRAAVFRPGEYVSANLPMVRPDWAMPFLIAFRDDGPHIRYRDPRFPRMNGHALTRDEAHILHATARQLAGRQALEVGCSMGWTTLHLLASGMAVDVVDPLLGHPLPRDALIACLDAESRRRVRLIIGRAADQLPDIAPKQNLVWHLVFVDSLRELEKPEPDTVAWERYTGEDAAVFFHGLADPKAAQPLRRLKGLGWRTRVYRTAGWLSVAWRGRVAPVDHIPDPNVAWAPPPHLDDLM